MTKKQEIFSKAFPVIDRLFQINRGSGLGLALSEAIAPRRNVVWKERPLELRAPNTLTAWRIDAFFEKEPETVAWLDTFQPHEIYFDVGANVGLFAIYAAVVRQAKVWAFEPEALNFAILSQNLRANGLAHQITALALALGEQTAVQTLRLSENRAGSALHQATESADTPLNLQQHVLQVALDDLVKSHHLPEPHHVKIDVDGNELRILQGMPQILAGQILKSIQMEVCPGEAHATEISIFLEKFGWRPLKGSHSAMFNGGPYERYDNVLFVRSTS